MKDPKDDYIRYADSLNKKHTLQKKGKWSIYLNEQIDLYSCSCSTNMKKKERRNYNWGKSGNYKWNFLLRKNHAQ